MALRLAPGGTFPRVRPSGWRRPARCGPWSWSARRCRGHGRPRCLRAPDILRHPLKERRVTDVCGVILPIVQIVVVRGEGKGLPQVVAFKDLGVTPLKHFGYQRLLDGLPDDLRAGPEVPKVDRPVGALAQRLGRPVDVDSTRQGVRHYEHGRRQIVGADLRVDAGLEISISGEHRGDHQALVSNGSTDRLGEGTRIPIQVVHPYPTHADRS